MLGKNIAISDNDLIEIIQTYFNIRYSEYIWS